MRYDWQKKLTKGTEVKLITRKNRRFRAMKGIVISHGDELVIKGKDGKVYKRKKPQKIFKEMLLLTESISLSEIESLFHKWANTIWKGSKLLSQINFNFLLVPNKEMKNKVLMSVAYASRPWAMRDNLIQVPKAMTVRVNERLIELPAEKIVKIVIHEAVHIGYSGHDSNFISLCVQHGGVPSELSASEDGYKVQTKKGGRYATVKAFPVNNVGLEAARIFGRELKKNNPNEKIRIVL